MKPRKLSDVIVELVHYMRQFGDAPVHGMEDKKHLGLDIALYKVDDKTVVGIRAVEEKPLETDETHEAC